MCCQVEPDGGIKGNAGANLVRRLGEDGIKMKIRRGERRSRGEGEDEERGEDKGCAGTTNTNDLVLLTKKVESKRR